MSLTAHGFRKKSKEAEGSTQGDNSAKVLIPVWEGQEYARIAPGRYTAAATRIIGPEYVKRWRRYSVGICFCPFSEPGAEVVLFLNLTKDIGRGSNYYRCWTLANGGPPTKGQKMTSDVFLEGQTFEIEVVDARKNSDGECKSDAEVYSKVKRIASVQHPNADSASLIPFRRK